MRSHRSAMVRWCRGAVVRWWPAVRRGLASYWTIGIAAVVMTGMHGRWLYRSCHAKDGHAGDVLSAYGAGLVALGLWVAVMELLRVGVAETARRQAENNPIWFAEQMPEAKAAQQTTEIQAKRALIVERVIAGLVALTGTLLNGWGTPFARRWGLPV